MRRRRFTVVSGLLAAASLVLIAVSIYQIQAQGRGIARESVTVGSTPVEIFRPAGTDSYPAVMVAHGFSGSRQIMYSFGYTLAHNGYLAALIDFPGHGRNLVPLRSDGSTSNVAQLDETLTGVADYLGTRADVSPAGRVATVGHSMGTAAVISYGLSHANTDATVAVSDVVSDVTPTLPRNLRLLTGALEFANLKSTALEALRNGGGEEPGRLYGDFAQGTARELDFVSGSEHVTILFNRETLALTVDWLNQVFGRASSGWTDSRMIWVLALYAGALVLFFPLSQWAWRRRGRLEGHRMRVGELLLFVGLPALVTPLLLWLASPVTDVIPVLVANYQAVYFFVAGMLTLFLLWWTGHLERRIWRGWLRGASFAAGVLIFAYLVATLFIPGDLTWASLVPTGQRIGWFFLFTVLCFPYFLADASLSYGRGRGQTLWRFLLTKALFLGSILFAIQLMPDLFFIMLLLPFLLIAWALFAAYSTQATSRLQTPVPGAVAMSLAFAWFMASLFPLA